MSEKDSAVVEVIVTGFDCEGQTSNVVLRHEGREVDRKPIENRWRSLKEIPATTKESDAMSKDLKKRGFRFVGSTICYAFMQAVGMVNDHVESCFRHQECGMQDAGAR